jgi:hypothetical protein
MNRREFCASAVAVSAGTVFPGLAQRPKQESGFPVNVLKNDYYIEETPIACYRWAPPSASPLYRGLTAIKRDWGTGSCSVVAS